MNNLYKYITRCGLRVLYYKKEEYSTNYIGIGCKFGSSNLKYEQNGNIYIMKDGIAHFLEHKLFQMLEGIDAYQEFDKLNAISNAYTTFDKTVYFVKTVSNFYKSLELLLNMYFTPCFIEKDIEKEKDIIISEIKMTEDNTDFMKNYEILQHTYPNDDYSSYLTGKIESVKSINKDDLDKAYNLFYTPENSVLTIVSSNKPEDVFSIIEQYLSNLTFKNSNISRVKCITSTGPLEPAFSKQKLSQNESHIILRLDDLKSDDSLTFEKIMCIFDNLFSISSKYVNKLIKKKLFENDIDFECTSFKDSSYAVISAPSKKCLKFCKEIINKLNKLSIKDLDMELLDIRIKYVKSDYILSLDNIDYLGDQILSLALEDLEYFEMLNNINNLSIDDLQIAIDYIRNCKKTYLIFNKKFKINE